MFLTTVNVMLYLVVWYFARTGNPLAGYILLVYTIFNGVAAGLAAFTVHAFNKKTNYKFN